MGHYFTLNLEYQLRGEKETEAEAEAETERRESFQTREQNDSNRTLLNSTCGHLEGKAEFWEI